MLSDAALKSAIQTAFGSPIFLMTLAGTAGFSTEDGIVTVPRVVVVIAGFKGSPIAT